MTFDDDWFSGSIPDETVTRSVTGEITIGESKFLRGHGHVRRAIAHEHGHYYKDIVWSGGTVGGTPTGSWHDTSTWFGGDGRLGYNFAIENSGGYRIPFRALLDKNQLTSAFAYDAWINYAATSGKPGFLRYLYLIPRK